MNSDGTVVSGSLATGGGSVSWQPLPASGPSADVLAALTDSPDPVRGGDELHYTPRPRTWSAPARPPG